MLISEVERLTFKHMIEDNLHSLTRIRNGKPAAHIYKPPRIRRFVAAGILTNEKDHRYYKLTPEARDELNYIRLKLIQGERE